MTFTESVNLVGGGIRLVDAAGATVPTSDPTVDGHTVTWPMPADLPEGAYVVTWRVVSADGHPISGASSFGGTAAAAAPGSATDAERPEHGGDRVFRAMARGDRPPVQLCRVRLLRWRRRVRAVVRTGNQQGSSADPGPRRASAARRRGRRHPGTGPVRGWGSR